MGGLAKGVGYSAKIQEAKFPKELRDRRNVGGFYVEVPCNEDGAFRVHLHFGNDGRNDGAGFGSLHGKLGTISEAIYNIA